MNEHTIKESNAPSPIRRLVYVRWEPGQHASKAICRCPHQSVSQYTYLGIMCITYYIIWFFVCQLINQYIFPFFKYFLSILLHFCILYKQKSPSPFSGEGDGSVIYFAIRSAYCASYKLPSVILALRETYRPPRKEGATLLPTQPMAQLVVPGAASILK